MRAGRAACSQAEPLSPWDEVASYVLYHEFGEAAEEAVRKSAAMRTEPWTVAVTCALPLLRAISTA